MKTICKITRISNSSTGKNKRLVKVVVQNIMAVLFLCGSLLSTSAIAQSVTTFDPSPLVKIGDNVRYGAYIIYKLDEGIYKLHDPGIETAGGGANSVDMYLICGEKKALMIDLGNNFIKGRPETNIAAQENAAEELREVVYKIAPRENAAEELREVVYKLAGNLLLEITITHSHGDHTGMIGAFVDQDVLIWKSKYENVRRAPKPPSLVTEPSIDYSNAYTLFTPGEKTFDLGGGRIVETFSVKGHTNDGVVYILKKDLILFTGDALGSGGGPVFTSVQEVKDLAEDSQKLVDYLKTNWKPYERYAMRVFTGHTFANILNGYYSPNLEFIDLAYLNWRFIQDMALCAKGILEGKWLVEQSGLVYVGDFAKTDLRPGRSKRDGYANMVYGGMGTIMLPIEVAYEAAGLEMPE